MSGIPKLLVYAKDNRQYVEWGPLVDGVDYNATPQVITPIVDATVTATLYFGRSLINPGRTPGTAVPGATTLALAHVAGGVYRGTVLETFDPEVGTRYVTVVDAHRPSGDVAHWEVKSEVVIRRNNE